MANYCRHNFHEECEAAINKQTNLQLHVSYCYLALVCHLNGCTFRYLTEK